jgi:hypothetical protein
VPFSCPTVSEKQDLLRSSPRLEFFCRDSVRTRHRGLYRVGADLLSATGVGGAARRSSLQASRVSTIGLSELTLCGQPSGMLLRFSWKIMHQRQWLGKYRQSCRNMFVVPNYPSRPLTVTKTPKTELRWSKRLHIQDQGSDCTVQTSLQVATPMHCLPM